MAIIVDGPITVERLEEAFTEWERRYREDPENFEDAFTRLALGKSCETYGEVCAQYLLELLKHDLTWGDRKINDSNDK